MFLLPALVAACTTPSSSPDLGFAKLTEDQWEGCEHQRGETWTCTRWFGDYEAHVTIERNAVVDTRVTAPSWNKEDGSFRGSQLTIFETSSDEKYYSISIWFEPEAPSAKRDGWVQELRSQVEFPNVPTSP